MHGNFDSEKNFSIIFVCQNHKIANMPTNCATDYQRSHVDYRALKDRSCHSYTTVK